MIVSHHEREKKTDKSNAVCFDDVTLRWGCQPGFITLEDHGVIVEASYNHRYHVGVLQSEALGRI